MSSEQAEVISGQVEVISGYAEVNRWQVAAKPFSDISSTSTSSLDCRLMASRLWPTGVGLLSSTKVFVTMSGEPTADASPTTTRLS